MSDPGDPGDLDDDRIDDLVTWTRSVEVGLSRVGGPPGSSRFAVDVRQALRELQRRRGSDVGPALDVDSEVSRIMGLGEVEIMMEIARLAAGRGLTDDEDRAGRVAAAYRARAEQLQSGEHAYLALLRRVVDHGRQMWDLRGESRVRSVFGAQIRLDLRRGFPAFTTNPVDFPAVVRDVLATSSTLVPAIARDARVASWPWWSDDFSIVQAARRGRHCYQFNVDGGDLDVQLYHFRVDLAVGLPPCAASYALFLALVARECRLVPRYLVYTVGDAYVLESNVEGAREQAARSPMSLPSLGMVGSPAVCLQGYRHHPAITYQVSP